MSFDYRVKLTNPFENFLADSSAALDLVQTRVVPKSLHAEFTRNAEQRNFCAGLVNRVMLVAFAHDRLCELTDEYNRFKKLQEAATDERGRYTYTDEMLQAEARWNVEVDLLTFYAYYELKSIIDILAQWNLGPQSGSELEFAAKARDRFLAHPELCRVAPKSHRSKGIPCAAGPTRSDIASLNGWDPITRGVYLSQLGMTEPTDIAQAWSDNAAIVLSSTRNERLREDDVLRLKAFGTREPDLPLALSELADVLADALREHILPQSEEAIAILGFRRIPRGPTSRYSQRLPVEASD